MAKITLHPKYETGEISEKLFSAFLEPIGTIVNGFMYNPKHETADEQGFRGDVIEALKATGLPAVRLPGGNFVSAWQWKDSIGPKSERKIRLDPAWYQFIPNDVGHDEYLQWAEKIGTEPLYTVNMGTGNIQDAMDLVEYTNFEGSSWWSDLRKKNGHEKPYGVKTWYLGNEMDGPWQLGSWSGDPEGYGRRCREASKALKWIDASISTGVCGSSASFMEGFPEWDEKVLDQCYDVVDLLSVHHYHSAPADDVGSLLGGALYYEDFINTEAAVIDYVAAKHRSPKRVKISFDEYGCMMRDNAPLNPGWGRYNMARSHYKFDPERPYLFHDPDKMKFFTFPGREILHMLSALSIQLAFLRHADRVEIGCMTGGLGALCEADHDHVWKSASHYGYMQMLRYARGTSMKTVVDCDTYDMPGYAIDDTSQYTGKEGVPYIDSAAAWDKENGRLCVFAINRNEKEDYSLNVDISAFEGFEKVTHYEIFSDPEDPDKKSSFEAQDVFAPVENKAAALRDGICTTSVKPLSWNVFVFESKKA